MPRNSTTYKISGTKTFRLGSSAILDTWGSNLQNIEKSLRRIYISDKGKVFIQVDQSGAEALIVSYLTRHGKLRDLFLNKIKPHTYLGLSFPEHWEKEFPFVRELGKEPLTNLKNIPEWKLLEKAIKDSDNNPPATRYYYHYKQTCHSSNYNIGASTFQMNLLDKSGGKVALTRKQAETYLMGYHAQFPEIREWHRDAEKQLWETHYLFNLFGYPFYFDTVNDGMMKEAYAIVPQSTVGCITHIAYTKLQDYIEKEKLQWDLMANTHDSYLVQCPDSPEEIKHCSTKMQEFMNQSLTCRGEKFSMKSEIQVGGNWSPFHLEKNPQGLKEYFI